MVVARWVYWGTEPAGFTLRYSLGKDFDEFLRGPVVAGTPTYGVAALHGVLALAGVGIGAGMGRRMWADRHRFVDAISGRRSPTAFATTASMIAFGAVYTLTLLPVHRHYMILTFPLMGVWLGGWRWRPTPCCSAG